MSKNALSRFCYTHPHTHTHTHTHKYIHRIWFWVQDATEDSVSRFNLSRDSIYGAAILLGIGGATILTIAMTMISSLIGDNTVSSGLHTAQQALLTTKPS